MRKRRFVIISLVLVAVLVFALTACGGGGAAPAEDGTAPTETTPVEGEASAEATGNATYKMKASTYLPESDDTYPLLLDYCDKVRERTNGDVDITVYPAESLGPYDQTFEETMRGTIEFGFNAIPATKDARLEAGTLPGLVGDFDQVEKFLSSDGTVFKTTDAALDDLNVKLLGWIFGGHANLVFAGEPEPGYADPAIAKKATIRVPSSVASYGELIKALNYKTASLNGSEVYSSLQTGIIDGTIGQSNAFVLSGYSDVVKTIVDMKVMISPDSIFINKDLFESMPAEYQQIIQEEADILTSTMIKYQADQEKVIEEELGKLGITVIHLTPEERALVEGVVVAKVWPFFEERISKEFVDSLKAEFGID